MVVLRVVSYRYLCRAAGFSKYGQRPQMALFTQSTRLLPKMGDAAATRLAAAYELWIIALHLGQPVAPRYQNTLTLEDGSIHDFDACFPEFLPLPLRL